MVFSSGYRARHARLLNPRAPEAILEWDVTVQLIAALRRARGESPRGMTVLAVVDSEHLVARAEQLGRRLTERLNDFRDRYEQVGDVRGRGLLQGLELVLDKTTKEPADKLGASVTAACLERGLHMNIVQLRGMGGIFRIAPPLTVSDAELAAGLDILDDALAAVLR
jgi:2,2-dialkylglycine decarboxylase (pyruvate)